MNARKNMIIGTISESVAETWGDEASFKITIPYTFSTDSETITTPYRFTFTEIPRHRWFAYRQGNLVKIDFSLYFEVAYFDFFADDLTLIESANREPSPRVINRITGTIDRIKNRDGVTYVIICDKSVPFTFRFGTIPKEQQYIYQVGNVVTVNYNFKTFYGSYCIHEMPIISMKSPRVHLTG